MNVCIMYECKYDTYMHARSKDVCKNHVRMHDCMYVCMYACMHACMHVVCICRMYEACDM